jgi:uncharacterized membrane protein
LYELHWLVFLRRQVISLKREQSTKDEAPGTKYRRPTMRRLPAIEYRPLHYNTRRPLISWLIVVAISILAVSIIVGAPLAAAANHNFLALALYGTFRKLCHQLPERSFFVAGHQFAVCARCTGLYVGFMLAVLFYPLVRPLRTTEAPPRRWLFIAALPMIIDVGLNFLGVWENTHSSRFVTGLILSVVSVFYVIPGISELSLRGVVVKTTTRKGSAELLQVGPSDYGAPERRI